MSKANGKFPILNSKNIIHFVPWELVAPHEAQALKNHSQTLERLAQRGGLDWAELFAVMNGLSWPDFEKFQRVTEKE